MLFFSVGVNEVVATRCYFQFATSIPRRARITDVKRNAEPI
jgi:hypothetical protein